MGSERTADDLDAVVRRIAEGTAAATGERFFAALVRSLAETLRVHGAWVTEWIPDARRLRARAFWLGDSFVDGYEYAIDGTPCATVLDETRLFHVPDNVVSLFPRDPDLRSAGALSYLGVPLTDVDGTILGHLAVLDKKPMPSRERDLAVFRIFAARAAAELQRLRAERAVREVAQELTALVGGALDGIAELDAESRRGTGGSISPGRCPRLRTCAPRPRRRRASRGRIES